jgi:hypothetical protein
MFNRKPFSEEQFKQDDRPAKVKVAAYITNRWGMIVSEGEQYGVDLVCSKDQEIVGLVEVERRHNWVDEFPFRTVHVPARKAKFFVLEGPVILFSVRSDLKKAMWCKDVDIMSSPIELLDNKHCENEDFFVVPLEYWRLVDL